MRKRPATWHACSPRTQVWLLLNHPTLLADGLGVAELRETLPHLQTNAVNGSTKALVSEGYLVRGGHKRWKVSPTAPQAPIHYLTHHASVEYYSALLLVEDCPAGIDDTVLATELGCRVSEVRRLLARPVWERKLLCTRQKDGRLRYQVAPEGEPAR